MGAAALNNRLYVCGGYDGISSLNTVECYHPETDTWTIIPSMQKHRSAGGVIGFEGYVYALGGHNGLSIFDSVSNYLTFLVAYYNYYRKCMFSSNSIDNLCLWEIHID